MTTKRLFECDLCHQNIGDVNSGIGIFWTEKRMIAKPYRETEHHLCTVCVRGLREVFATVQDEPANGVRR